VKQPSPSQSVWTEPRGGITLSYRDGSALAIQRELDASVRNRDADGEKEGRNVLSRVFREFPVFRALVPLLHWFRRSCSVGSELVSAAGIPEGEAEHCIYRRWGFGARKMVCERCRGRLLSFVWSRERNRIHKLGPIDRL